MTIFDFSTFPTLATERLVLREPVASDAPYYFVAGSDAEVQKYNMKPMQHVSEAETLINELADGYAAKKQIYWAITLAGADQALGLCGFNYWSRNHNRAGIGYDLARVHWKKGIGREAVGAMLRFGFERMMLHRIEASTVADNFGSVNMLKKLGFQLEGLRREHSWEDDGCYHDVAIYGLLKREHVAQSQTMR